MGGKMTGDMKFDRAEAIGLYDQLHLEFDLGEFHVLAGSLRRGKYIVGDLDIVLMQEDADRIGAALWGFQKNGKPKKSGVYRGIQVDLYPATTKTFGAMVVFATGSGKFNIRMRKKAQGMGYKLNQYGVWDGDRRVAGAFEEGVFDALGMLYVIPEERI